MRSISFANELPQCLVYPPSAPVPETCINIEAISTVSQRHASIANKSPAIRKSQSVLFFFISRRVKKEIEVENLGGNDDDTESVNGQVNVNEKCR